jgi:hypothetical protein
LHGENLEGRYADEVAFAELDFRLPVALRLKRNAVTEIICENKMTASAATDPVRFAAQEHLYPLGRSYGQFACRTLRLADYRLNNVAGIWRAEGGLISVPRISIDAYEGIVQGALSLRANALSPDSLEYWLRCSGLGLNTAKLPGARDKEGEDSQISAFARLSGKGIDLNKQFTLQGSLDITHIGRGVADNILRFLDPNQSDPSIQTYRSYIKRGWGVKVFSFNVKDDFVYASITPSRPPISRLDMFILSRLIGIGKSITFGRVPLRFFLTTQGSETNLSGS